MTNENSTPQSNLVQWLTLIMAICGTSRSSIASLADACRDDRLRGHDSV